MSHIKQLDLWLRKNPHLGLRNGNPRYFAKERKMTVRFICVCDEDGKAKAERCEACLEASGPHQHLGEASDWTCPIGWRYKCCIGCGTQYPHMRPEKSIGNASVEGPLCRWCVKKLDGLVSEGSL